MPITPSGALAAVPKLVLNEHEMAAAIGLTVHFLRRDRCKKRLIPFYKIGGTIRYNVDRVREALADLEEGGARRRAKGKQ